MAAVLGISCHYHDAAAALVIDGRIVAAMQEERFSRIKNDPSLPRRAAHACLAQAGIRAADLTRVVFYENPSGRLERVLTSLLRSWPASWRQFPRAWAGQIGGGGRLWVLDQIEEMLDYPDCRVEFSEHHKSHAASAFYPSPFARAAVITVDGVGEETSTALWKADESGLHCLSTIAFPHSLGLLYAAITAWLGFEVNEGEYKVMGLAAFGQPRYLDLFSRLLHANGDGSFELDLDYFSHTTDVEIPFTRRMESLLGPRRPAGRPWNMDESDIRYADIAASLQRATEDALLALAREAKRLTGMDSLCLAGGVALNAVANARLRRESGFAHVFVQPAAGDAGGALGAAMIGALECGDSRPAPMTSAALGQAPDESEAAALARALGHSAAPIENPPAEIARRIAQGQVVAVARGRFEWGPRALGQRSLLALPGDAAMRERINRVVKQREPFRPFAPAVLAERAAEFFTDAPSDMTPFMTTVCPVRDRQKLAAVTHVDGTARVQTVAAGTDFHAILSEVERLTGIPVVLNTSMNGPGDPIAAGAADALAFFSAHAVDALVVGDLLIERG